MRDLATHQAGAVLCRRDFDAAAGIENGDDEWFQFLLDALCERNIENLAGYIEGEFSNEWIPL